MKTTKTQCLLICLAILASALAWNGTTNAQTEQDVVKVTLGSWCPYSCDPETEGGKIGFLPDMILSILQQHGLPTQTMLMPYSRIIYELREGKWHIAPGMAKPNAPDFIFTAEPVVYNSYHFFVKQGTPWRFEAPEALDSLSSLGLIQDYSYDAMGNFMAEFMQANPDKLDWITGNEPLARNLKKLLAGRVEAIIADRWTAAYQIEKLGMTGQIIEAGKIGSNYPIYIGFSPVHPRSSEYAELINEGIQHLKTSGAMQEWLEKYHLTAEIFAPPAP